MFQLVNREAYRLSGMAWCLSRWPEGSSHYRCKGHTGKHGQWKNWQLIQEVALLSSSIFQWLLLSSLITTYCISVHPSNSSISLKFTLCSQLKICINEQKQATNCIFDTDTIISRIIFFENGFKKTLKGTSNDGSRQEKAVLSRIRGQNRTTGWTP